MILVWRHFPYSIYLEIPWTTMGNKSVGKESACNEGDLGSIPGWEDPLEKGKATHSSIPA